MHFGRSYTYSMGFCLMAGVLNISEVSDGEIYHKEFENSFGAFIQ